MQDSLKQYERLSAAPANLLELLDRAPFGSLGISTEAGPYVAPISFARNGDHLVFHGASGRKSAALARDGRVSLSVVDSPRLVNGDTACNCTFDYYSLLVWGTAELLLEAEERSTALRAIVAKYHPAGLDLPFDTGAFNSTVVYRLAVHSVSEKHHQRP
jgi:nitroimidazol reductase NimA-like FMN-containing flavoprotein (pyridoxamine 5'-phosphate oxidase superfamily)